MNTLKRTALVACLSLPLAAEAATIQFTATSATSGGLGWIQLDDAIFGSGEYCEFGCWIDNTLLTALYFADRPTGLQFTIADVNPGGEIRFVDNGGPLPLPLGGRFDLAYNFALDSAIGIQNGDGSLLFQQFSPDYTDAFYDDVTWTATYTLSSVPASTVPLPATGLLLAGALGLVTVAQRRRGA
ncbi:hypothetical protein [Tropicibacter sp. S64]|uniref:hypothetical protein n=1 Tax=Tropicibacter sp. S64 TaxID=3415122 RepID=UPI003C7B19F2